MRVVVKEAMIKPKELVSRRRISSTTERKYGCGGGLPLVIKPSTAYSMYVKVSPTLPGTAPAF